MFDLRRARPYALGLMLLGFIACGGGGCPREPGDICTPGSNDCRGDFYCSVGGVCTKACENDEGCDIACDENRDCSSGSSTSQGNWRCQSGVCACMGDCPEPVACYGGYCQRACAEDNSCGYTPYEPRGR